MGHLDAVLYIHYQQIWVIQAIQTTSKAIFVKNVQP